MNDEAKVAEKTVRYFRINEKIASLSASVRVLEKFIREVRGDSVTNDDSQDCLASNFHEVYSAVEGRLNGIKARIVTATANLRELIEG